MKVLEAKSDDELLRFFIVRQNVKSEILYEFFYRYSSQKDGKTTTVVSEKERYKSFQSGFRLVMQDVLALLSQKRSKLDISAISDFQSRFSVIA